MIKWTNMEVAGMLPEFLSVLCEDKAVKQLDDNYQHGGGWMPMEGWKISKKNGKFYASYMGDEELAELSRCTLRDETVVLFEYEFVAVIQKDKTFEIARMT